MSEHRMTMGEFLDNGYKFVDGDMYTSSHNSFTFTVGSDIDVRDANTRSAVDHHRTVVYAKALQKPRTKTIYEKVNDSLFSLENDFESGKLYFKMRDEEYHEITKLPSFTSKYHNGNVYRKVEVEITPMQAAKDACDKFVLMSVDIDIEDRFKDFLDEPVSEEFETTASKFDNAVISLCRAIVNAYDGVGNE